MERNLQKVAMPEYNGFISLSSEFKYWLYFLYLWT